MWGFLFLFLSATNKLCFVPHNTIKVSKKPAAKEMRSSTDRKTHERHKFYAWPTLSHGGIIEGQHTWHDSKAYGKALKG